VLCEVPEKGTDKRDFPGRERCDEPAGPGWLTGMRTASSAGSYACGDGRLQANKAGARR